MTVKLSRTVLIIVGILIAGLSKTATAQPTDTLDAAGLLERWAGELGGAKRLASVQSVYTRHAVTIGGLKGHLDTWATAAGDRREEIDLGIYRSLTIYRNGVGWTVGPNGFRSDLAGSDLADQIANSFLDSYSHFFSDRLPGTVTLDEDRSKVDLNVLLIKPERGSESRIFLDRASGLPRYAEYQQLGITVILMFDDWRVVEGIKVPHRLVQTAAGPQGDAIMLLEEIVINGDVSPHLFLRPDERVSTRSMPDLSSPVEIPFQFVENFIQIDVEINGSPPRSFILDTGAGMSVIDQKFAEELGLDLQGELEAVGAGPGTATYSLTRIGNVRVGTLSLEEMTFAAMPLGWTSKLSGLDWYGILGYDFLSRFVVEIDFESEMLRLFNPVGFLYEGPGDEIPLMIDDNHPRIYASLEEGEHDSPGFRRAEGIFTIDTGHSGSLTINRGFAEANNFPSAERPSIEAPGGHGLGGEIKARISRVGALRLGRFQVHEPITAFSRDETGILAASELAGVIGNEILRRFRVVLDYRGKRLILEPGPAFDEEFEFNTIGAWFRAEDSEFRTLLVYRTISPSPASEAGIREGDRIVGYEGEKMNAENFKKLISRSATPGMRFRITLQRRGKEFERVLTGRRLI